MDSPQWPLFSWCARLFRLSSRTVTIGQDPVTLIDVSPTGPDIGPVDALHTGCVHGRAVRWRHISGGAFRQVSTVPFDMRWSIAIRPFLIAVRGSGGTRCRAPLGNVVVVGGLTHGPAVPVGA